MSLDIRLWRVDKRLLHSTIVINWGKTLNINYFIVVDNEKSKDPFYERILSLGLPQGSKVKICDSKKFNEITKALTNSSASYRAIVVFRSTAEMNEVVQFCDKVKEIQFPYAYSMFKSNYLSQNGTIIENLKDQGIKFYLQNSPYETKRYI